MKTNSLLKLTLLAALTAPYLATAQSTTRALKNSTLPRNSATLERAQGGVAGGGGMFIQQINGKVMTLTEAGYIFDQVERVVIPAKDYASYYFITDRVKAELETVLSELGMDEYDVKSVKAKILGPNRATFLDQAQISASEYEKIKNDYVKVLSSFGYKVKDRDLILPAYSKNGKTFILPDFVNKLDDRQKALNLIHEFSMRGPVDPTDTRLSPLELLKRTLKMDSAIERLLASDKSEASFYSFTRSISASESIDFARALSWRYKSLEAAIELKEFAKMILQVEVQKGRPLLMSELFLEVKPFSAHTENSVDPSLAKQFNAIVPRFAEKLEKVSVSGFDLFNSAWQYRESSHLLAPQYQHTFCPIAMKNNADMSPLDYSELSTYQDTDPARNPCINYTLNAMERVARLAQSMKSEIENSGVAGDGIITVDPQTHVIFMSKPQYLPTGAAPLLDKNGILNHRNYGIKVLHFQKMGN